MASNVSLNGREEGDDAMLPDAPDALDAAADTAMEPETEDRGSEDEYAFLYDDSQIPRPQQRSSDEESFQPSEPDEHNVRNPQPESNQQLQLPLIKPESEDEETLIRNAPASPPLPWSPAKRRAGDIGSDERPFKRAKGAFNREYLNLLNVDIEDAAAQYVPHDEAELPPSQIGLTYWTSVEKELFFTALSRLGRDDAPGIARRIRTKGELEVRQYLRLLQDATVARKREYELEPLYPQDFPAAVEIGAQCSTALEVAADGIASRQERHEESVEEMRWDDDWLITPFNYRTLEKEAPPNMPSLRLFRVSTWLQLSERLFMNANYPENNWQHVSDDNPSIRTTALEDFYSLAVSVTKRLVAATIYVSESRARAKQDLDSRTKDSELVWPKDVEAAALSLGLKTNSKKFWTGCARRLRVDVIDDEDDSDDDSEDGDGAHMGGRRKSEDGQEPMTYDEVEAALGGLKETEYMKSEEQDDESAELVSLSDTPSLDDLSDLSDLPPGAVPEPEPEEHDEPVMDIDEDKVQKEAKELLLHTAMPYPLTTRTRRAVEGRIRSELQHVAYADAVDAKASQREERRLWNMLGRDPPDEVDRVKLPDRAPRRAMHTVDDMYPSSGNWRDNLSYVSEWARTLPRKRDD